MLILVRKQIAVIDNIVSDSPSDYRTGIRSLLLQIYRDNHPMSIFAAEIRYFDGILSFLVTWNFIGVCKLYFNYY